MKVNSVAELTRLAKLSGVGMYRHGLWRGFKNNHGISLVEVTMLVMVVAIMMAVAMKAMTPGIEEAKQRMTEQEMEIILKAIVGDPSLMSVAGGVRSDFGYVGDVGAFPPNLDALIENPGGYSTWDGPYIPPEYIAGIKTDEWGKAYSYNGGLEITSHGSGTTTHRRAHGDSLSVLYNTVFGYVRDANDSVPGAIFDDSVNIEITVPDGAGGIRAKVYHPDVMGEFTLDSIPIGRHRVIAIFTPEVDTLTRYMAVLPHHNSNDHVRFNFAEPWFSSGDTSGSTFDSMLTLVDGSVAVSGAECQNVTFSITNNTETDRTVASMTVSWSGPTAYYQTIRWGGTIVFTSGSTRIASGTSADIIDQIVLVGDTVTISVEEFRNKASGSSSRVNMGTTDFTIAFSDGSIIQFTTPACP